MNITIGQVKCLNNDGKGLTICEEIVWKDGENSKRFVVQRGFDIKTIEIVRDDEQAAKGAAYAVFRKESS